MSTTRNSIEDSWGGQTPYCGQWSSRSDTLVTVLLQASRALRDLKLEDVVA